MTTTKITRGQQPQVYKVDTNDSPPYATTVATDVSCGSGLSWAIANDIDVTGAGSAAEANQRGVDFVLNHTSPPPSDVAQ